MKNENLLCILGVTSMLIGMVSGSGEMVTGALVLICTSIVIEEIKSKEAQ